MSSKNKGADQLRGNSRGGLRISFRTYKKFYNQPVFPGRGKDACIYYDRKGFELHFTSRGNLYTGYSTRPDNGQTGL